MKNHCQPHHDQHNGDPTQPCGTCRKRHVRSGDARRVGGRGHGETISNVTRRGTIATTMAALAIVAMAVTPGAAHAAAVVAAPSLPREKGGGGVTSLRGGVFGKLAQGSWGATSTSSGGNRFETTRLLETADAVDEEHEDHEHEEEDHDFLFFGDQGVDAPEDLDHEEDGHDDHDHEDEGVDTHDDHEDEVVDDHEDHDHEEDGHDDHDDHGLEVEEDGHDDHDDHGHDEDGHDDHDDHSLEDDGHDDHDDHSSHDEVGHGDHDDHSSHDEADEFSSFSSANESQDEKLPWGQVIGATLLVNLAALSGCLIVVMTAVQRGLLKFRSGDGTVSHAHSKLIGHGLLFDICIPAFAVGALVATAVFLIFPEALHLIEGGHGDAHDDHSDHEEEADAQDDHSGHDHRYLQEDEHAGHDDSSESVNAAKFGCAILGGFLLPLAFSICFHRNADEEDMSESDFHEEVDLCASCNGRDTPVVAGGVDRGVSVTAGEEGLNESVKVMKVIDEASPQDQSPSDAEEGAERFVSEQESMHLPTKTFVDRQLCASILLGDGFHNFADGVFIGAAFKSCSTSVALSIIMVTLFHEIAQELADFILLTRYAGLTVFKACAFNLLSGLTVCLGGIVFLAGDPSDEATGVILAMAGGVYFNIAACETIPRLDNIVKKRSDRVWVLFSVIVGTVPIGLVLLNHQHCG